MNQEVKQKLNELAAEQFTRIGARSAMQITKDIADLLIDNLHDIDRAYVEAEDGLSVSFSVKFKEPRDADGVLIETTINFVKERIKIGKTAIIDERQGTLFEE